jgi:hypothetical protein
MCHEMEENTIVDLTPSEMLKIIEENTALKAALRKATAAYLYVCGGENVPEWDTLPDEAYPVPESSPGAGDGGWKSGRATYIAQSQDIKKWIEYWKVA